MTEEANKSNSGKVLGFFGFTIGLIALIVGLVIYMIAVGTAGTTGGGMGIAFFWTLFSVAGFVLSFIGMKKSRAAGKKAGLALGGFIVGILTIGFCFFMMYAVYDVKQSNKHNFMDKVNDVQHAIDSTNAANNARDTAH